MEAPVYRLETLTYRHFAKRFRDWWHGYGCTKILNYDNIILTEIVRKIALRAYKLGIEESKKVL